MCGAALESDSCQRLKVNNKRHEISFYSGGMIQTVSTGTMADKDNKFKNEQTKLQQSAQNSKNAQVYLTCQTLIHSLCQETHNDRQLRTDTPTFILFLLEQSSENIFQQRHMWTEMELHMSSLPKSKRRYVIALNLIPNSVCLRKQSSSTAYLSYCAILCCFLTTLNSLTDRWCIFRQNILLSSLWFVFFPDSWLVIRLPDSCTPFLTLIQLTEYISIT